MPWTGLGLYSQIALTTEWQSFTKDFVATADETNARIFFDVGDSDIAVEVSVVSLRHLLDDKAIAPDPPPVQTGNPEREKSHGMGHQAPGSVRLQRAPHLSSSPLS